MGDAAAAAPARIDFHADLQQQQQQQEEEESQQSQQRKGSVYRKLGWKSLRALRALVAITLVLHLGVSALAIVVAVVSSSRGCPRSLVVAAALVAGGACVRIAWVVGAGLCQAATAVTMIAEEHIPASRLDSAPACPVLQARTQITRIERRLWYRRWLWWGRFGAIVTFVQVGGACYLSFLAVRNARSSFCFSGSDATALLQHTLIILPIATWLLSFAQCCVGSDVLSWRSLYEMQNEAWRAHYREIFDHGIREILCCLGRSRYMTSRDDDEVDSVAALLGDLVAYRAAGASHLEFLAGVSLLRTRKPKSIVWSDFPPAPEPLMKEAALLHPYAVAAYTGPLLDIGRNPFFFPCAWMYRQGFLTLWNRRRQPNLDGDNWWRGHATAFLGAARVPAEALLKGRVHQKNRETVYFVMELKQLKCVVIAVRGTETPEDLLTDGLGREFALSDSDIHGLLMSPNISEIMKQELAASTPHYGHAGVISAARELAFELDSPEDNPEYSFEPREQDFSKKQVGFLTSILGSGGRCEGYALRFVGHSLGGSIAAVAGMMLCHRFPALHVYGFGVLPCVDSVVAEACSSFVTSIVYNDEFSSRLSVASLMRLRAASLRALAADSDTDSAVVARLARRLLGSSKSKRRSVAENGEVIDDQPQQQQEQDEEHKLDRRSCRRLESKLKGGAFLCYHACHCVLEMPSEQPVMNKNNNNNNNSMQLKLDVSNGFNVLLSAGDEESKKIEEAVGLMSSGEEGDENGEFVRGIVNGELLSNGIPSDLENDLVGFKPGSDLQKIWPVELVMPGLVIHLLRVQDERRCSSTASYAWWRRRFRRKKKHLYRAVVRERNSFRDIVVSPSMFLDHMPWRCQRALNDVLDSC